jgi:hypothetical protein
MELEPNSNAHDALRSFLPAWYLRRRRDVWALMRKFEAREDPDARWDTLADARSWGVGEQLPVSIYEKEKIIGGLGIKGRNKAPFAAFDPVRPEHHIRYQKKDMTELHMYEFLGLQSLRDDIAVAAEYVETHKQLRRTKYIGGVTHESMAKLALRIGFQPMWPTYIDSETTAGARYFQLAHNAVTGKNIEPCPAIVYMPTDEFINRFKQS